MQQCDRQKECSIIFVRECLACLQSPLEGEGCSISHEPRKISSRESCSDVTPVTASTVTIRSWPERICREKSQRGTRACTDAASTESNSLLQYQSVSRCDTDTHYIQARREHVRIAPFWSSMEGCRAKMNPTLQKIISPADFIYTLPCTTLKPP